MKKYFLDTSIIISFLRGSQSVVGLLRDISGELTSSYICLAELYEGVYRQRDSDGAEEGVLTFFRGLDQVYGIDEQTARNFGKIRSKLRSTGKIIEDLDILIASICLANSLELITLNYKHFNRVDGLLVKDVNL